ncbi:hypothetical protein ZTR_03097 [Talaromyces verruculosus]|nr:hypothetical protein ZTR_03097 [Talaromyces verruculosus]
MGIQTYNKVGSLDSRFDELEYMILAVAPAIMTLMQKACGKRLQQPESSLQARSLGAQEQNLLLQGWTDLGFAAEDPLASALQDGPGFESQGYDFDGSQIYIPPSQGESYAIITQLELLGLFRVGPSTSLEELEFILQQWNRNTEISLRQVWWLNKMDGLVTWYREPCSSLLLVDQYLDTTPSDRISPLSIF